MNFITIDNKKECVVIYYNKQFHKVDILETLQLDHTWSYSPYLDQYNIEYAQVYAGNKTLIETCPDNFKQDLTIILDKIEKYFTSFKQAKINPNKVCIYDLLPEELLKQLCSIKIEIIDHVFKNYSKPKNYEFKLGMHKLIKEIGLNKLNIDSDKYKKYIKYDLTDQCITKRLKTSPDSFPILYLSKNERNIIKPTNDYFVELDFNGADLRTAFGLLQLVQPDVDIITWVGNEIWDSTLERSEIKKEIYSWMYNPNKTSSQLNKILDREKILRDHWDGQQVVTLMGETIQADREHALSYLIQSSTHEVFFERVFKLREYLKNLNSHIAFCIHDSVVIDLSKQDLVHMIQIKDLFSNTIIGKVKVNVSVGKETYGSMKKIC